MVDCGHLGELELRVAVLALFEQGLGQAESRGRAQGDVEPRGVAHLPLEERLRLAVAAVGQHGVAFAETGFGLDREQLGA